MGFLIGAAKWLPVILGAIRHVERTSTGKGVEKQTAAIELLQDLIPAVDTQISSRDLLEDQHARRLRAIIDGIVAMGNLWRDLERVRAASSTSAAGGG